MQKAGKAQGAAKAQSVRVNREDLLRKLEEVRPGLSKREIVQQSSCFAFADGDLFTFNEEIACRSRLSLGSVRGAVQADPLLSILNKLPPSDVEITIHSTKSQLVIEGKNKQSGVTMEKEIMLPIDSVENPDKWKKLHPDFTDAVSIVQECASKDMSAFTFTCVNVHPDFVEACDNLQLTRYFVKTGVKESFLVRRDSIKHVPSFDFSEFAVTPSWVHFRGSSSGLVMSCRRYTEKYEDLGDLLNDKGKPMTLPPALTDAAERCEIFSRDNKEDNLVLVELRAGKLRIKGEGAYGYHQEVKRIKYEGPEMKFRIGPKLLTELLKRNTEVEISKKNRLHINGGKFRYVACLEVA
jgi:DNA polymerase III sliding clamp (beta) subunit (PCNA family)